MSKKKQADLQKAAVLCKTGVRVSTPNYCNLKKDYNPHKIMMY